LGRFELVPKQLKLLISFPFFFMHIIVIHPFLENIKIFFLFYKKKAKIK
jgi:hypothetical protein